MAGVTGSVVARFQYSNGRTTLAESRCVAPLKIAKTFALANGRVGVCLMDCSPGLLAGDSYDLTWQLDPGARVFLTPQGFSRVHPSNHAPCRTVQHLHIGKGALLEYETPPVMLYRDAALRTECDVLLHPQGALILSEIVCAGRVERGEAFEFDACESRLRVRSDGELLCCHNVEVRPSRWNVRARGAWAGRTHWGQVWAFYGALPPHDADALKDAWRTALADSATRWPTLSGGVGILARGGIVAMLLGNHAWELQEAATRLRSIAREKLESLLSS